MTQKYYTLVLTDKYDIGSYDDKIRLLTEKELPLIIFRNGTNKYLSLIEVDIDVNDLDIETNPRTEYTWNVVSKFKVLRLIPRTEYKNLFTTNNTKTNIKFNNKGFISSITRPSKTIYHTSGADEIEPSRTISFNYDDQDNMVKCYKDCEVLVEYKYDSFGRVIERLKHSGISTKVFSTKFEYDDVKKILSRTRLNSKPVVNTYDSLKNTRHSGFNYFYDQWISLPFTILNKEN